MVVRKLTFIPHIEYRKAKCLKVLSFLKVFSILLGVHTELHFLSFISLQKVKIRLWLYYIWRCKKSYLIMLDQEHRLVLRDFRTSPVASLYV